MEKVSTGEYWFGHTALTHNLVDKLMTSNSYLLDKYLTKQSQLFEVKYIVKKSKLASMYQAAIKQLTKVGP